MDVNIRFLPIRKPIRTYRVYESAHFCIVVGSDKEETEFHVFKIEKKNDDEAPNIGLDEIIHEEVQTFSKKEFEEYMKAARKQRWPPTTYSKNGNVVNGAREQYTEKIKDAKGILGFVRFLKGYYILMIMQKKKVAMIDKHKIYQIKDVKMLSLFKWVTS